MTGPRTKAKILLDRLEARHVDPTQFVEQCRHWENRLRQKCSEYNIDFETMLKLLSDYDCYQDCYKALLWFDFDEISSEVFSFGNAETLARMIQQELDNGND